MIKRCFMYLLFLALFCSLCLSVIDSQAAEKDSEKIDPKVQKIIKNMSDYISELKSLSVEIYSDIEVTAEGETNKIASKQKLSLQRPNKLALIQQEGNLGSTIVYNGKKVYQYVELAKAYMVEDAPDTLNELEIPYGSGGLGAILSAPSAFFMEFVIRNNPYSTIMEDVESADYIALVEIQEKKYHHFILVREDVDLELWVSEGDTPYLYKIKPNILKVLNNLRDQIPPHMRNMEVTMNVTFNDWEKNPDFPDNTFEFTPPADARMIDQSSQETGEAKTHPLEGKKAPAFQLELLEGGTFDLEQEIGESIIILDFWASWCGPCRTVMPILDEVAHEFKEKGVTLIAVNLRETPQQIRDFLESQELNPKVALDENGQVANSYGVQGIPQTVIIGKEGTIQKVFIGAYPDMKERLTTILNDLLDE